MLRRPVWHPSSRAWQLALSAAPFVIWVAVWFIAFGGSAWHPTDYEHMPAFTYRFASGEMPYRDFIYHKTPGSLFLHVVWQELPDWLEVRASRLFVYFQIAVTGAAPLLWALGRGQIGFGWRLGALGCASTAVAMHNFPVTPWQTIDGACFATLGWVALLESTLSTEKWRALLARAVASALLGFALLCKQSFVLVCAAFAAYVVGESVWLWWRGEKPSRVALRFGASVLPALLLSEALQRWLVSNGALRDFLYQLVSESTPRAFWRVLTGPYANVKYLWVLLAWALVPALPRIDGTGARMLTARVLALCPLGLCVLALVALPHDGQGPLGPALVASLAGMIVGQLVFSRALHGNLLAVGVVAVALSTQVSIGYITPILGVAGFGVILHGVLPEERSFALDIIPAVVVAGVALCVMWSWNDQPYRDGPREALTQNLGDLFPRLSGIRTTPSDYERYAALKQVVTQRILPSGRPFAILQDYPGAHWLFGTRNPTAIDWNWPLDAAGFENRIIEDLERTSAIAIVPKARDAPWGVESLADDTPCAKIDMGRHALVSQYVVRYWRLVGENRFFCLFEK